MWGWRQGTTWQSDWYLTNASYVPNQTGQRYASLMDEWTTEDANTTDPNGKAGFRGFHGSYEITLSKAGETNEVHTIELTPGSGSQLFTINTNFTGGGTPDTTPPTPNPMTWASVPTATGSSTITMTATTASDSSPPVQYYFECTNHGEANSTWQTSTTYIASGLNPSTLYTFRVKARDSSSAHNETGWSSTQSATTLPPGTDVNLIGSWVSGTTHAKESGTSRALIFIAHAEYTASMNLSSVTYGGQAMTKVMEYNYNAVSGWAYAAAFILKETGVAAATSGTFVPTWSTTPGASGYSSAFFSNVDQTTSIGASASGGSTTNPVTTSALSTNNGDMVILAATCGNSSTYTLNNSFIEGTDQQMGGTATGVTGRKHATGVSETPSATYYSTINRQMIIGFVLKAAAGSPVIRTLTVSSSSGGTVTTPGIGSFNYSDGNTASIIASANANYHFVNWTGTAVTAGKVASPNSPSTTVLMDANYTVQANFAIDQKSLTTSATSGGTVTTPGIGTYLYDVNTTANIVASANANYHFVNWTGSAVTAGKVTDPNAASTTVLMDANYTVQANFAIDQKSLTTSASSNGTVTTPGIGTYWYNYGSNASIVASANANYHFVNWTGSAVTAGKVTDPNAASTIVLMDANYTVQANFAIDQKSLTTSASSGGTVTTPGIGIYWYNYGSNANIVASANANYHFVNWTGSAVTAGKVANPNAPATTVLMNYYYTVQANFEADAPPTEPTNLTATAGNGTVSLDWNNNTEPDLAGYNVYRSTTQGSGYSRLNGSLVSESNYIDSNATNGTPYYYVVTAVDTASDESGYSNESSATPTYQDCSQVQAGHFGLKSDLNGDCHVDYKDLNVISYYWLNTECANYNNCGGADFEPTNGTVDFADFSNFAVQWMQCNNPQDAGCVPNW
jgi:hypothetical protein